MRFLFFKESFAWPRAKGHDVHGYHMMQALAELGHEVSLLTSHRPPVEAIAGLPLAACRSLDESPQQLNGHPAPRLSRLQERFRSYWGIDPAHIHAVAEMARECRADAVVVVGLNVLPYLASVEGALRVWYAADEWVWHHLSQVRWRQPSTWINVRHALLKGLYERAYAALLDRIWVVSESDRRAMRWVTGAAAIDVVPNGVDGEHYRPLEGTEIERSCVFWGRLDFGPNLQALEWFCRKVWPRLHREAPASRFTIYGFNPTVEAKALAAVDGVTIVPDLPDLRREIACHQVVVLPFVSGGGVKNKLLEAASMAKAIVCTPRACGGLLPASIPPFVTAGKPAEWAEHITHLWSDEGRRRRLGTEARRWVLEQHTWAAAARTAVAGLDAPLAERRGR